MFGHQDNTPNGNQHVEPVADGMLSGDAGIIAPAPQPPTPLTMPAPASSAPVIDDAAASDYIMTNAPHADGDTKPSVRPQADDSGLLSIKQQALQQLSPLVGHLEQTPEEKFRTTMMMIQASDDQSLITTAYEAAQQITDEKTRAQALLDVVNEINYFTQQQAA